MIPNLCIPCYNDDAGHPLGAYGDPDCKTCDIKLDAGGTEITSYKCDSCNDKCKLK